jgi:hypothetical protein
MKRVSQKKVRSMQELMGASRKKLGLTFPQVKRQKKATIKKLK